MIRKSKIDDQEHSDRWLLTYADLLTLLLAFFVLMYGMSKIDAKRFGQMAQGLQGVFHGNEGSEARDEQLLIPGAGMLKVGTLKQVQQEINVLAGTVGDVESTPATTGAAQTITTEMTERGLVVHIRESALFESGKAELKESARLLLDTLAHEFKNLSNHLRIEGHTDSRPISTERYPSNWELSAARASAVVRYLIAEHKFSPDKLSALGFGEFRPRASNSTPEGLARNRRVDIVILTEELSAVEPHAAPGHAASAHPREQFVAGERKSFPTQGPTP
ncbi:MAG: flagellar motor protein MotB [bacterium]